MGKVAEKIKIGRGVKVKAICVFGHGDQLLVIEQVERDTGQTAWKMPGGNVELGETTYECAVREVREELGAEIRDVDRLGVIENIFQANGQQRHQIVFVYRATFTDPSFYGADSLRVVEGKREYIASWKPMSELYEARAVLRPQGLLDLLGDKLEPEAGPQQNTFWRHTRR